MRAASALAQAGQLLRRWVRPGFAVIHTLQVDEIGHFLQPRIHSESNTLEQRFGVPPVLQAKVQFAGDLLHEFGLFRLPDPLSERTLPQKGPNIAGPFDMLPRQDERPSRYARHQRHGHWSHSGWA